MGNGSLDSGEPRSGDRELVNLGRLLPVIAVAPSGARYLWVVDPRLAKLALGLTLTAATQLVEGSPLVSSSSIRSVER